jgi:hypothetical protein
MTKEQYIKDLLSYSDDVYFDDTKIKLRSSKPCYTCYWGDGNTDTILAVWEFEYKWEKSYFYDYDKDIAIYAEDIQRFFSEFPDLDELIYKAFDKCLEDCIEDELDDYEDPDAKYDERKENWYDI